MFSFNTRMVFNLIFNDDFKDSVQKQKTSKIEASVELFYVGVI